MTSAARSDTVWKSETLGKQFLEGVRGAIPFAEQQIQLILFILEQRANPPRTFLDLGCGDGILGRALLNRWPEARGVFLDFSDTMIAAAKDQLASSILQPVLVTQDYGQPGWTRPILNQAPFDVIISGFSIHHQPDSRKKELYGELFDLLSPAGWFLNLEHVSSPSPAIQGLFDRYFIESLCRHHERAGTPKTPEQIATEYYHRPDKAANILAPVETQCQWLREAGFKDVDCYFKIFELALFGGRKPD
jgi:ubiquinone/menaquinone biosynthesis C-methylase UbiE